MLTIIAVLCHLVTVDGNSFQACHEEVAFSDLPMSACPLAQIGLAQWKANGPYSSDEWRVAGFKCAFGSGYVLKGRA
jgi:hypothetical protein